MKTLSLLLLFSLLLIVNANAQNQLKANQNTIFYSDTTQIRILGSLPEGEVITPTKTEGDFYKIRFRDIPGYVKKSDFSPLQVEMKKIDLRTNEEILTENLEKLARFTKLNRRSLNAMYLCIGASALFTGIGIGTSAMSDLSIPIAMYSLAGISGLGAIVSSICVMEFQAKINSTNTKIQYLGNGLKVTF